MVKSGINTGIGASGQASIAGASVEPAVDRPHERQSRKSRSRTDTLSDRLSFDFEAFDQFVRESLDPLAFITPARLSSETDGQMNLFLGTARAVIGVDEVGRGCLAGPVVAGAVLLPGMQSSSEIAQRLAELDDSKKLSSRIREDLAGTICSCAHYAVAEASPAEIDEINIFHASLLAMKRAVLALAEKAQLDLSRMLILIDGNKALPGLENVSQLPVIKGDTRSAAIAAASVVAKVHRDAFMAQLAGEFPAYGWHSNKGYPSRDHRRAIAEHGLTPWHRRSFRCLPDEIDDQVEDEMLEDLDRLDPSSRVNGGNRAVAGGKASGRKTGNDQTGGGKQRAKGGRASLARARREPANGGKQSARSGKTSLGRARREPASGGKRSAKGGKASLDESRSRRA